MKEADLKPGDIFRNRNGNLFLVLPDKKQVPLGHTDLGRSSREGEVEASPDNWCERVGRVDPEKVWETRRTTEDGPNLLDVVNQVLVTLGKIDRGELTLRQARPDTIPYHEDADYETSDGWGLRVFIDGSGVEAGWDFIDLIRPPGGEWIDCWELTLMDEFVAFHEGITRLTTWRPKNLAPWVQAEDAANKTAAS